MKFLSEPVRRRPPLKVSSMTGCRLVWFTFACCAAGINAQIITSPPTASNNTFYRTSGHDILDPQGNIFYAKGVNLNGWLVPEAYGMAIDNVHSRHLNAKSDIESNIVNFIGQEAADDFWKLYLENYFTAQDILDLKKAGFNAVRLPFNYRLVSPQDTPGVYSEEGFAFLDKIIQWCKDAGIAILLDMHSCPGGQSHDPYADPEYSFWREEEDGVLRERGVQVLWEYHEPYFQATGRTPAFNQQRTADIWREIAKRYVNEPTILGYELANEPYYYPITGVTDETLRQFFIQVTQAVREVDPNHIVMVEGNIFAEEIGGLLPPWDDNMVIAFHRYWRETGYADGVVDEYLEAREEYNVPFLLTESGENSDPWIYEMKQLMESNGIGWFFWGFKKADGIALHYEVGIPDTHQYVIDNWRDSPDADPALIKQGLMDFAEASKSETCRIQPGYFAAMVDPLFDTTPQPFTEGNGQVPGLIYAAHYDIGNQGVAYSDERYKNEEYQGVGWNLGWIFRNGGVDIGESPPSAQNGVGYHIFSMSTGEWISYTVTVAQAGWYSILVRARNADDASSVPFSIATDSEFVNYTAPNALFEWTTLSSASPGQSLYLPAGTQHLIVSILVGGYGLELAWMDFFLVEEDTGTQLTETMNPTKAPAATPTMAPADPTMVPSSIPSTSSPTGVPTSAPVVMPSAVPTKLPTSDPTMTPTTNPTTTPTFTPSTSSPTGIPTSTPVVATTFPSAVPTQLSTVDPTMVPTTSSPTGMPTSPPVVATALPSVGPTQRPAADPTTMAAPTGTPTESPTSDPSSTSSTSATITTTTTTFPCSTCPSSAASQYVFSPIAATWEMHDVLARQEGCVLASITSPAEQEAAVQAMAEFIGYPYHALGHHESSYAYLGGRRPQSVDKNRNIRSNPNKQPDYSFEWTDGSLGLIEVQDGAVVSDGNFSDIVYTNFHETDPNGGINTIYGDEPYLALSLNENESVGIPRGKWIDFSNRPSPALYKCCVVQNEEGDSRSL